MIPSLVEDLVVWEKAHMLPSLLMQTRRALDVLVITAHMQCRYVLAKGPEP